MSPSLQEKKMTVYSLEAFDLWHCLYYNNYSATGMGVATIEARVWGGAPPSVWKSVGGPKNFRSSHFLTGIQKCKWNMGPSEKIVDQIRGVVILGLGLVGPGLGPASTLKNPWRRSWSQFKGLQGVNYQYFVWMWYNFYYT